MLTKELQKLEDNLFGVDDVSALLGELRIEHRTTAGNIYIPCPECDRTDKEIFIRVNSNKDDRLHWTCFKCKTHQRYYDNLIGLVRRFNDELTPKQAYEQIADAMERMRVKQ